MSWVCDQVTHSHLKLTLCSELYFEYSNIASTVYELTSISVELNWKKCPKLNFAQSTVPSPSNTHGGEKQKGLVG